MNTQRFFTIWYGFMITAIICCLLWGSAFPMIKLSYAELGIKKLDVFQQILFAGYRFLLASLFLLFFLYLKNRRLLFIKGSLLSLLQISLFQTILQYIFFYIGISFSSGIEGSILTGSGTFFSIFLAHYMYANDRMSWNKLVGLILGFVGISLASSTGDKLSLSIGVGGIAFLLASFSNSFGAILTKNKAKNLDTLYLTTFQMLIGSLVLLVIGGSGAGFFPFHFHWLSMGYLVYLAFLSAAGFSLWNTLLKYNKVGKVSMYFFLVPVFGVLQSALLLGEPLHAFVWISLAFVVLGIVIVNLEKQSKLTVNSHTPLSR